MTVSLSRHHNAHTTSGNTYGNAHAPPETAHTRCHVQHRTRHHRGVPRPSKKVGLVVEAAEQVLVAEAGVRAVVVRVAAEVAG